MREQKISRVEVIEKINSRLIKKFREQGKNLVSPQHFYALTDSLVTEELFFSASTAETYISTVANQSEKLINDMNEWQ
jgi:hypothetical protein